MSTVSSAVTTYSLVHRVWSQCTPQVTVLKGNCLLQMSLLQLRETYVLNIGLLLLHHHRILSVEIMTNYYQRALRLGLLLSAGPAPEATGHRSHTGTEATKP